MKKIFLFETLLLWIISSHAVMAQLNSAPVCSNDAPPLISYTSLKGVVVENVVYLTMVAPAPRQDCYYIVMKRGDDGKERTVALKEGYHTDANIELMYCFSDKKAEGGLLSYRVAQVVDGKIFGYTETLEIENKTTPAPLPELPPLAVR